MEITDITIRKLTLESKMKAVVSITFDDQFVVHDVKVIEGNHGLFIAMPSRRTQEGEYKDIVHPINSTFRDILSEQVLAKYKEAIRSLTRGLEDFDEYEPYAGDEV
ncbi:MAG: septation regulator SpoVG [Clostridiales bacterium]|nr:septation regulator SpoVG [Clostridiales bacterium]